jgi:tRNA-Thr(GGU) m(6)t(6)A37 methyltransferase TsaA
MLVKPISYIETPFTEKFGIPRQPLLVNEAWGKMVFPKNDFFTEAFRGIEESSHLWLIFEFHEIPDGPFNGLVRPPRFENKMKMGVYATRTPHRPNRLGLSVVEFDRVDILANAIVLWVKGVDLLNKTPIFDIKPYVPYVDSVQAKSPFHESPEFKKVIWNCEKVPEAILIEKVIGLDPRPGQDKDSNEEYGLSISGYNVRFKFLLDHFEVISVVRLK